ncbi:protein adenylyltransferase SelO [Uliginosibacterium sediminicola]|uniref:Protein nucleotidyltransferase YdiU n=1 Tax=Uliginosibacterium sediminicola TaxID=2024550 RepID=A0ABU9Z2E2_9RHOO
MNARLPAAPSPARAPLGALETLCFDNRFAQLPAAFYTRLAPRPLPAVSLVGFSANAAASIGLAAEEGLRAEFAEVFAGNRLLTGSEPLAAVYSGHQFGSWSGQLGDGRAHLLGGVRTADGMVELQLKGAGPTPYSRFSDGRAVLRSSIREFLCSEAMHALGIPTTRALCVIGSPEPVIRETVETAAVVTRMAPSFVRFGSFEHWSALDREAELRTLADYIIDEFRPQLRETPEPYAALLADVAARTAELIAHWQAVGFMHGVMNTDNMSILGLTLDYGPFGFMEAYNASHICNHSDHSGRYAFRMQPRIGHWNLYALGDALQSLIGHPDKIREIVDRSYVEHYDRKFLALATAKLGFAGVEAGDADFLGETYGLMQRQHLDHTQFFRALSALPGNPSRESRAHCDAPLRDQFIDRDEGDAWLLSWRARLAREGRDDARRQAAMRACNPKYILRNWIAEAAIRKAQAGDFSEVARVLACLQRPFDEQAEFDDLAALPPDWAAGLSISCSS